MCIIILWKIVCLLVCQEWQSYYTGTGNSYQVDACSSSFGMIQTWTESFFQLNVHASISSKVCLLYVDYYVHFYMKWAAHMCSLLNIDG